jgi:hypothetical protein
MKEQFNPFEYNSYKELPKNQKKNFKAIEDGSGFVLKNVEKNPEIAHRLAIIEDQAINALKQEIEINNLSLDNLILKYRSAGKNDDYSEQEKILELLRQVSDYSILKGGKYDEKAKREFKKNYEDLTYSEKTQNIIIDGISKTDLEVGGKLLVDDKFSLKDELLEKIGDNDDLLKKLYNLTHDNLDVADLLVSKAENSDTKINILKDALKGIGEIKDSKKRNEKMENSSLNSIKRNVAEGLVRNEEYDTVLQLIEEGCLEVRNLRGVVHAMNSDKFLYDLASKSSNSKEVVYLFKFIADAEIFAEIVKNNGESLVKLPESEKQNIVVLAEKFLHALTHNPEIYQVGNLQEDTTNKFIVGISSENNTIYIAWSNTADHEYHKDIFEALSRNSGKEFPEVLRSGGWLETSSEGNKIRLTFLRSSGDFGNYSQRVLEKFRENISAELQKQFENKEIELEIKVSS